MEGRLLPGGADDSACSTTSIAGLSGSATDAALLGRPEGLCARVRACGVTRPRERSDVRDVFILDTLASIDGMVFVRVAIELAA